MEFSSLNAEADMSSVRPNIKEIGQNVKQWHSVHFCFGKVIFH